jgi:hypothetical protein
MISDEEIFLLYGKNAVVSRKGTFVLIHLDRPSRELVRARTQSFDPDTFFDRDCRVCSLMREGGIVVFDDSSFEDDEEEIIVE